MAGQNAVKYTFDNANRLTQISQSGTGTVGLTYDSADRRALLTLPDSVTQTYGHDAGWQLKSLTYKHGSTTLGTVTYTYDANGRRSTVAGGLATVALPATEGTNAFNADNEMTSFDGSTLGGACPERSRRDSEGQLTSDPVDTFSWDTRRHLSAVSGYDGASFVGARPERSRRNALGRRVSKTVNGTTTQFLGACPERSRRDGLNPVEELNASGAVVAKMLTGLNVDEYFQRTEPGCCGPLSYISDALGSTVALADSNGVIQNQYQYEPFGNTGNQISNNTSTNSYEFTGRENDTSGFLTMYYYRGRYYEPAFQRFISQDPMDFSGGDTNLYGYVLKDPLVLRDPTGRLLIEIFVGGAVGGVEGATAASLQGGSTSAIITSAVIGAALGGALGALDPTEGRGPDAGVAVGRAHVIWNGVYRRLRLAGVTPRTGGLP